MAVTGKGKYPNQLGWLNKKKGRMSCVLALIKDRPTNTGQTMWNDWFFPSGSAPTYFGILKRWTGASWIKEPLKVYLGSFVSKPLKRWNGTEWKLIDTTGV